MVDEVIEITVKEMDALIERMEGLLTDGLSPEPDDIRLIVKILRQFATMQHKLEGSTYLKERYLKLMGLVSSSENQDTLFGQKGQAKRQGPRKQKKTSPNKPVPPTICHHKHESLKKGQTCPECGEGKLYKSEPASFIRIKGRPPLRAERHISEQLRCNLCGRLFAASLPDDVLKDGAPQQKYGHSARTVMAINKFFMGNPYYRQESFQSMVGVPVTASTVYDQCALLVDHVAPVFDYLKQQSANAYHFNIDDTGNRILSETGIEKPNRNGKGSRKRTGIYSSCLIATWDAEQRVALFKTNIGHAGEWIDEILSARRPGLAEPIVMSDALSSNIPQSLAYQKSLCNAHSRRKFVDVLSHFPEQVEYIVDTYATIWGNETHVNENQLTRAERLAYHQVHSLPIMETLRQWCSRQLREDVVEENSGLGKAMQYFLNHFEGLSAFCRIEGAMLDNNLAEMILKLIARGRKNSQFYKSLAGAHVGDVITSLIATCELNGINAFDYLLALQENRQLIMREPQRWLPWNYTVALDELENQAA